LLPLWRDRDTVQIGIDPRRAVAITGVGRAADVLRLLDGSRDRAQVVAAASERGIAPAITERILTLLAAGGALIDFPAEVMRSMPRELRRQLIPELTAASLARLDADGGAELLARRSATAVAVCGSGRIADAIADLLTSSGLAAARWPALSGHAQRTDAGPIARAAQATSTGPIARPGQASGTGPIARPGQASGTGPVARPGQASGSRPRRPTEPPDLAIVVGPQSPGLTAALQRRRVPHLAVSASEAIGIVGPLVRPGVTACLRCIDMTRADRDPAWPLILAQLTNRSADPPACDAALAAAVAAQAAAQAVAFADRAPLAYTTVNGTLELVLPAWQWRRRTWPPHPGCTCAASHAISAARTSLSGSCAARPRR
jgi:bacteriocin biosynthesis cyclodehydratase domain-containing protein